MDFTLELQSMARVEARVGDRARVRLNLRLRQLQVKLDPEQNPKIALGLKPEVETELGADR